MSKIKELRQRRKSEASQVIDITSKIENASTDRIPDQVWEALQEAGAQAAVHLVNMLDPVRFDKLAAKDQRALVDLALSRAYGRPDNGVKRSVQVQLSASGNDAVAASLNRLDARLALPEYVSQSAILPRNDETTHLDSETTHDTFNPSETPENG